MYRLAGVAVLVVLASLVWVGEAVAVFAGGSMEGQQKQEPSKSKRSPGAASMAGCVDQQDGRYVLVDERSLSPIADLVAEGFPMEGFAKYLGHKVIVRGTSKPGETRPLFRVRGIEAVSDVCAPESEHQ